MPDEGVVQQELSQPLKPINKSGHYGHLSAEQAKLLAGFEAKLHETGVLPSPELAEEEQRETVLLDWNIDNASKMYSDTLKWRKEVDLSGMLKTWQDGGAVFEEREQVAEDGWKMYFHGTDRYNRPIFVQDLSHLKVNEVFTHTTPERIIQFFAIMLETAVQQKYAACTNKARKQAKENGVEDHEQLQKIIVDDNFMILNVEGLGMGTFWAFKNQLQQLLGILDANYPELSGRIQIINAPWLFTTIFSYIKGWLPVNTVEKIGVTGLDFQKELFEYIDPSALPESLGGTCKCSGPGGCAFSDRGPWRSHSDP